MRGGSSARNQRPVIKINYLQRDRFYFHVGKKNAQRLLQVLSAGGQNGFPFNSGVLCVSRHAVARLLPGQLFGLGRRPSRRFGHLEPARVRSILRLTHEVRRNTLAHTHTDTIRPALGSQDDGLMQMPVHTYINVYLTDCLTDRVFLLLMVALAAQFLSLLQ